MLSFDAPLPPGYVMETIRNGGLEQTEGAACSLGSGMMLSSPVRATPQWVGQTLEDLETVATRASSSFPYFTYVPCF
jgi:hypothetical protein